MKPFDNWSKEKLQALYRAQRKKRDPFFKHPRDFIKLREMANG